MNTGMLMIILLSNGESSRNTLKGSLYCLDGQLIFRCIVKVVLDNNVRRLLLIVFYGTCSMLMFISFSDIFIIENVVFNLYLQKI